MIFMSIMHIMHKKRVCQVVLTHPLYISSFKTNFSLIASLLINMRLNPADVAEVHAVRQKVVLRIHTQAELHASGIVELVGGLEEEV